MDPLYPLLSLHKDYMISHLCLYKYPSPEPLKLALVVEAKAWKTAYGHDLNARYRTSMENIVQFVTEYSKRLARPIKVHSFCIHSCTL